MLPQKGSTITTVPARNIHSMLFFFIPAFGRDRGCIHSHSIRLS